MNAAGVEGLLWGRIGLDPASLGEGTLRRIVREQAAALGEEDIDRYARRVATDAAAFEALVEAVAVPESWFFRGGALFEALAAEVRRRLEARSSNGPVRVLSVPCSTGEEPYSLAIALAERGIPAGRCTVLGVDLSRAHVEHAKRGRYADLAFRETAPELLRRYFVEEAGRRRVADAIRSSVDFAVGNVVDDGFLAGERPFDLILCRNLMIYLHSEARRRALSRLMGLLRPGGWLCLGHADQLGGTPAGLRRLESGGVGAYVKVSEPANVAPSPPALHRPVPVSTPVRPARPEAPPPSVPRPGLASTPDRPRGPAPAGGGMAEARRLADAGRLEEALAACQELARSAGRSAELFSLMGVIQHAMRRTDEARVAFQNALYLDPDHVESLTHLELIYLRENKAEQARLLRLRLDRAAERER